MFSPIPILLLAVAAAASELTLQTPRIVVFDSTGSQLQAEPYVFRFLPKLYCNCFPDFP